MPKLGILFDIEGLGGGAYGMRAYQTLLGVLDSRSYPNAHSAMVMQETGIASQSSPLMYQNSIE